MAKLFRAAHRKADYRVIGIYDLLEAQAVAQQARDNLSDAQCQFRSRFAKYMLMTGN
jgi:hypothetical protein